MSEIKPCPFCGGECTAKSSYEFFQWGYKGKYLEYWVACHGDCDYSSPNLHTSADGAIAAHNDLCRKITGYADLEAERDEAVRVREVDLQTSLDYRRRAIDLEAKNTKLREALEALIGAVNALSLHRLADKMVAIYDKTAAAEKALEKKEEADHE